MMRAMGAWGVSRDKQGRFRMQPDANAIMEAGSDEGRQVACVVLSMFEDALQPS